MDSEPSSHFTHLSRQRRRAAYTVLETLVGITILLGLMNSATPALHSLQGAGNMTRAAYEVAGVLENARTYAAANRTYVWVGFFEEDTEAPGTAGTGRVILSTVASRDGTEIYDEDGDKETIPPQRLLQIGKLTKIENAHLALFDIGTGGDGGTFAERPCVNDSYGRFGEINAASGSRPATTSRFPFTYPLSSASSQYTFKKTLLFTPRGEAKVNGTYTMRPVVEIGLQPARGNTAIASSKNIAAVQLSGILGQVKIYKP